MSKTKEESLLKTLEEQAADLSDEARCKLAGMLLEGTPCDRDCILAFLAELDEDNKDELATRLKYGDDQVLKYGDDR